MSATVTSFCRSTKRLSPLAPRRDAPDRQQRAGRRWRRLCGGERERRKPGTAPRRCPRRGRRRARRRGRSGRCAAARGEDRQRRAVGNERRQRFVVAQLAARLREEMDGRIPAAGHADEIAVDASRGAASERHDVDGGHVPCAVRAGDRAVRRRSAGPRCARRARQRAVERAAGRASTIAATATPAPCRASAAACALSLFVNTTACDPGAHRVAFHVRARLRRAACPAGRCSRTRCRARARPLASTTRLARTFHSRCRGMAAGGAAR